MALNNITRHVGKIVGTDQRVVVLFMQIPDSMDRALVLPTDNLPLRLEQAVMDILRSPEGQAEETFGLVLGRRLLPETGRSVLEALHHANLLTSVPVEKVLMLPQPNMPVPLTQILAELGRSTVAEEAAAPPMIYSESKFNPHAVNQTAASNEQRVGIARNLLIEADLLEAEARAKREKAFSYAPELRPQEVAPPSTTIGEATEGPEAQALSLPIGNKTAVAKRRPATTRKKQTS